MSRPPRILFVAMQGSIHVARWIQLMREFGWDLHLFPLDTDPVNRSLSGVTVHMPVEAGSSSDQYYTTMAAANAAPASSPRRAFGWRPAAAPAAQEQRIKVDVVRPTLADLGGIATLTEAPAVRLGESEMAAPHLFGPSVLASVIRRVQPDFIHSMEFQHAAYLVLKTKEIYGEGFPKWLATNWGSDIYYFGRQDDHAAQIRRVLASIDLYSCECRRDLKLARDFGYTGPELPVLTNTGGFDLDHLAALRTGWPPSKRKRIMIKGYQHFAGRALTALKVVERHADLLKDYEVVLYSVSPEPRKRALEMIRDLGMNIRIATHCHHDEILMTMGTARLYMGISISDAISTSVLESMAMGAFPIQTNTSCCDEWFKDGEGGFIVSPDDEEQISDRFRRALTEDDLVDRAAIINQQAIETRLDVRALAPRLKDFYETGFQAIGLHPPAQQVRA